ncbi:MAG: prephenate dehydrogenase/arogenate dehydrogenase family protein [Cellvibrionaceae bacterium]
MSFNRLVIIGIGLIGGSLGAALKKRSACSEVIGIARREETCVRAKELGIVDRAYTDLADIAGELGEGDVIFVSVPTLAVATWLQTIKDLLPDTVTITDGASVKGNVVKAAESVWGELPSNLVPGHPIAGSEKSGVNAANPDLYVNHRIILTPSENTDSAHYDRVEGMWLATDAEVLSMPVDEHDVVLAATSHLPHVLAYSLVDTLAHDAENENIFRYAAGGFRDFTRIASSDPVMWHDIMSANREEIVKSIDLFAANLSKLREMIDEDRSGDILELFKRAKFARDEFAELLNQKQWVKPEERED